MRWAAKRDTSEKAIVDALEAIGAAVWKVSAKDIPDLIVAYRGRYLVLECKTGNKPLSEGQQEFLDVSEIHDCPCFRVTTPEEALLALQQ